MNRALKVAAPFAAAGALAFGFHEMDVAHDLAERPSVIDAGAVRACADFLQSQDTPLRTVKLPTPCVPFSAAFAQETDEHDVSKPSVKGLLDKYGVDPANTESTIHTSYELSTATDFKNLAHAAAQSYEQHNEKRTSWPNEIIGGILLSLGGVVTLRLGREVFKSRTRSKQALEAVRQ